MKASLTNDKYSLTKTLVMILPSLQGSWHHMTYLMNFPSRTIKFIWQDSAKISDNITSFSRIFVTILKRGMFFSVRSTNTNTFIFSYVQGKPSLRMPCFIYFTDNVICSLVNLYKSILPSGSRQAIEITF